MEIEDTAMFAYMHAAMQALAGGGLQPTQCKQLGSMSTLPTTSRKPNGSGLP